jgi:hypothetical protein
MAANSLYPSYVVINYHSSYGKHKATIPTRQWNALLGTNGKGGYLNWNEVEVDAADMFEAYAGAWKGMFPSDVSLDDYIIYDYDGDPDNSPNPVAGDTLALAGTEGTPVSFKAVMSTMTYFDTSYDGGKIISLDCASLGEWERRTTPTTAEAATFAVLSDFDWAFSSRSNLRPNLLRSITRKLNDELRKQYGMS